MDPDGAWPDLHSLVMLEAQRRQGNQVTAETRYYISRWPADARILWQAVRRHWGIENSLHWVLDMAFREDESRIRIGHAAHNLSILRRMALNLLRRETTAKGGPSRGLSLPEIRCFLWHLVLRVPRGVRRLLAWSYWCRRHQWVAQGCHYRRQQLKRQQVQL